MELQERKILNEWVLKYHLTILLQHSSRLFRIFYNVPKEKGTINIEIDCGAQLSFFSDHKTKTKNIISQSGWKLSESSDNNCLLFYQTNQSLPITIRRRSI